MAPEQTESSDIQSENKGMFSIEDGWYVALQGFKGETYVHVRQYVVTTKRLIPTKKGVGLRLDQWKRFELYKKEIQEEAKKAKEGEETDRTWHLGNNWFVTVNSDFPGVDFRRFYLPEDATEIRATKRGVFVPFQRFERLAGVVDVIPMFVSEVSDFVPCFMRDDHQNQAGQLACKECNPNGQAD